mmetsp:Transcript_5741/g.10228  ORF Transcript_5741/g.10228 Transcript_5741/m.10228 type:complete len:355 (-) Transcript_5741:1-1065(-)
MRTISVPEALVCHCVPWLDRVGKRRLVDHLLILVILPEEAREQHSSVQVGIEDGRPLWIRKLHLHATEECFPGSLALKAQCLDWLASQLHLQVSLCLESADEAGPYSDDHCGRAIREDQGGQIAFVDLPDGPFVVGLKGHEEGLSAVSIRNTTTYDPLGVVYRRPLTSWQLEVQSARSRGSSGQAHNSSMHAWDQLETDLIIPVMQRGAEQVGPPHAFLRVVAHGIRAALQGGVHQKVAVVANPGAGLVCAPQTHEARVTRVEPPTATFLAALHCPVVKAPGPGDDGQRIATRIAPLIVTSTCKYVYQVYQSRRLYQWCSSPQGTDAASTEKGELPPQDQLQHCRARFSVDCGA